LNPGAARTNRGGSDYDEEASMKTTTTEPHGRREFLKRAAVTGGAVTVAAAAGAAAAGTDGPATVSAVDTAPESRGYRMTDHIERYYRLARF
jgi:nitrous oxide reductase